MTTVLLVAEALRKAFGPGWIVLIQMPIALDDRSEPEPDVCVVRGEPRDYRDAFPSRPALLVEVADAGLAIARKRKAAAYARAGITDYWIVNLGESVVEIHRGPMPAGPSRPRYRSIETLGPDDTVSPLETPSARIRIADLLP